MSLLDSTPYASYVYAYPHKTAYRRIDPAIRIKDAWKNERRDALFLYFHVPFCEMRCGFCNLFTSALPEQEFVTGYLNALERQTIAVKDELDGAKFARFAIGGGTPTLLETRDLARLLDLAESMGADLPAIPCSVETSPETATYDRLKLLRERGIDRISIGIQSFETNETHAVKRPQPENVVHAALDAISSLAFPTFNIDLIYGLPEQTLATWRRSLERALSWKPTELYLYPLYVRPLTTLGRGSRTWDDERLALYRLACDLLKDAGYTQVSMRMFRLANAPPVEGPVYCVQNDGMVGLGPGARSYTSGLHYSSEYAVIARAVKDITRAWIDREDHRFVDWGFALDASEQRRRFIAMSLLASDGLDFDLYEARFRTKVMGDRPELSELLELDLARMHGSVMKLTSLGMERSDAIGPWLFSDRVRGLMKSWERR